MRWGDGRMQGESLEITRDLDAAFPHTPSLWAPDGVAASDVERMVGEWRTVFPRTARPSSRAAFLFGYDGEPLPRTTFETTLAKTEALLTTHADGPFFCGATVSAADVAWAPFLERYAAQVT